MRLRWIITFVVLVSSAGLCVVDAQSQIVDLTRSRYSAAAYYDYGEPGDVTVLVNVWGTVRYPGLYEIPKGTTLSVLFSLAGGPQVTVRPKKNQRTVTARLIRGSNDDPVFESEMANEILAFGADVEVMEGDVLTVETVERVGIGWRDIFPVVAAIASVTLAVERLAR